MRPRGLKAGDAELLFAKWWEVLGYTYHRAARAGFVRLPNGKSFCRSHDLFGCLDFLGFIPNADADHPDHSPWGVQVTTQGGRSERRKKVEAVAWPADWRISVVSHERVPDPACRSRTTHYWRIEDLKGGEWQKPIAVRFDKRTVEESRRST